MIRPNSIFWHDAETARRDDSGIVHYSSLHPAKGGTVRALHLTWPMLPHSYRRAPAVRAFSFIPYLFLRPACAISGGVDWSSDNIRGTVEVPQARGAGRFLLTAGTLQLILDALGLYAGVIGQPRHDQYTVRAWLGDVGQNGETVASASKRVVAETAYEGMCAAEPTYMVTLSQGGCVTSVQRGRGVRF